jgi:hypothetical protein
MGHITIAGDLVRRVYDHHPFTDLIRKHASNLAQHRRLANTRPPQ